MAGEHCGRACGYCGGCDAWYERPEFEIQDPDGALEDACWYCGRADYLGDCADALTAIAEDEDGPYERDRDREVA